MSPSETIGIEDRSPEQLAREIKELRENVCRLNEQLKAYQETINDLSKRLYSQAKGPQEGESSDDDLRSLARKYERQSMIMERDNAVARKLQESVSPLWLTDFEGVDFASEARTGARVGGDFYDVIKISENTVGIMIADVSGHGLPAAVIMATARMAFRTFATTESSPKAILARGNEALLESTLAGHHLTAFLGLLDTEMLTFQYVNASHYPPYLIRDKEVIPLDTDGLFVGMFDDPQYEQKCIQLNQNDKLFLYTDGLLNVFNGTAKEKAVSNLQGELKRYWEAPIRQLVDNIAIQIEDEPSDDIFILGLQMLRKRSRRKTLTISSIPSEVRRVEDSLMPAISAKGYGERTLFGIKLAVEEAVINAIKHGNRMDSTKKVKIGFEIGEDKVEISVADEGEGFDVSATPDPTKPENIESDSGRGLVLMKAYMDSVEFNKKGNEVRLLKYAPWYSGSERSGKNAFSTQK